MNKYVLFAFSFVLVAGCGSALLKKTPPIQNKLGIPASCIDPSGHYQPLTTITTRLSYNEKAHPYRPIQTPTGIIQHDFDANGKTDYVFVERSGKTGQLRLSTCINNVRRATRFVIHEEKQADFQTIYEAVRLYQGKLQLAVNRHEHNWGSDNETSLYRYDKARRDFVLVERLESSSSGDGLRSDTEAHYNLANKRYRRVSRCGSLQPGCRPRGVEKGRIVLADHPVSLFASGGKLYRRLVPD